MKKRLPLRCKEQRPGGGLHQRDDSLDCHRFTSALANSIALARTVSLSGPSGSGRIVVVDNDDDPTGRFKISVLPAAIAIRSCVIAIKRIM